MGGFGTTECSGQWLAPTEARQNPSPDARFRRPVSCRIMRGSNARPAGSRRGAPLPPFQIPASLLSGLQKMGAFLDVGNEAHTLELEMLQRVHESLSPAHREN
jgi:hypothetical protein